MEPKLRFKEFMNTNEWVSKKIKDIGKIITGKTPNTTNAQFWNGDIPFVTPTDIMSKIIRKTERHLTKKGTYFSKIVPKNSVLVTCIASIGKNAITSTLSSFNQQINAIIPNYNFEFVYYLIKKNSTLLESKASCSATKILNKSSFENIELNITLNNCEQQKIANFFYLLDKQLELWERKLELTSHMLEFLKNKIFKQIIKNNNLIGFTDIFIEYNVKNINNLNPYSIGKNGIKIIIEPNYSFNNHKEF